MPICWACPGPNKAYQTDGKTIVTLGSLDDPDGFIDNERADRLPQMRHDEGDAMTAQIDGEIDDAPYGGVTALPTGVEGPLFQLLHIIASMTRSQLLVFHGMLNGLTLADASIGAGFTKQNGSKVLQAFVRRFPKLGAFFASCGGNAKRLKLDVK